MVKVKVEYLGIFRDLAGGVKEEVIEIPNKESIKLKELIDHIAKRHGEEIRKYIVEGFGEELNVLILVNGVHANYETIVRDGDTVSILPPASGG